MISVIIPAYKNVSLLKLAVNSVLSQTFTDVELIVVDDTPDSTISEFCKAINDTRLRYYHNIPSKGAIDNWNYGLSLSKGDDVILLHHDESFTNTDYLARVSILLRNYDVVVSNKKVLINNKEKTDIIPIWVKQLVLHLKYPLFSLNVIGPCACVAIKRDILQDFDNRMHWKVDIDWYFRILKCAKKILYLDTQEIVSYHGHEGQITNNINIKENSAIDSKIIKCKYKDIKVNFCLWIGKILSKLK